jgi:parallel beta-helix repeat protein
MSQARPLLALVLLLALLPRLAQAATYYVATTGNDSVSCNTAQNPTTPKQTIRDAINNCVRSPGDFLYIRGGSYPEQLHAFFGTNWPSGSSWAAPITIAGYPGETVVINPGTNENNYDMLYTTSTYIILDNLIWDGSNVHAFNGGSILRFGNSVRVQNCVLRNYLPNDGNWDTFGQHSNGILAGSTDITIRNTEIHHTVYGAYLAGAWENLIEGCYFHDLDGYGIHLFDGSPSPVDAHNNVFRNNRIHRSSRHAGTSQTGCGMVVARGNDNEVYNNIITDAVHGCGIQIYGFTFGTKVYNNTIVGNADACVFLGTNADSSIIRNNICFNNGQDINKDASPGATISNNLPNTTNPQFQ